MGPHGGILGGLSTHPQDPKHLAWARCLGSLVWLGAVFLERNPAAKDHIGIGGGFPSADHETGLLG